MIKVIIEYKGSTTKKYFMSGDDKVFKAIYILITDKGKKPYNYHFICDVKNGTITIPSTSLIPKETAIIYINFKNNIDTKTFKIPIHSIYSLGQDLPTSLRLVIDFNV